MSSTFGFAENNFVAVLSVQHAAGAGSLVLPAGAGAVLGVLPALRVFRVCAVSNSGLSSESVLSILEATGVSGDTLSGVSAVEGTSNVLLPVGTSIEVRVTARFMSEVQGSLNSVELLLGGGFDLLSVLSAAPVGVSGAVSLSSSAFGRLHVCSGGGYSVSLPSPVGRANSFIGFRMVPGLSGLVSVVGHGSDLIDGAAVRVMWAREVVFLLCDGVDWFKVGGRSVPMFCKAGRAGTYSGIAYGTAVLVPLDVAIRDSCGLFDSVNHRIVLSRSGNYAVNCFIQYNLMNANGNNEAIVALNGNLSAPVATNVVSSLASSYPGPTCSALSQPVVAGDYFDLYTFSENAAANYALYTVSGGATVFLEVNEVLSW